MFRRRLRCERIRGLGRRSVDGTFENHRSILYGFFRNLRCGPNRRTCDGQRGGACRQSHKVSSGLLSFSSTTHRPPIAKPGSHGNRKVNGLMPANAIISSRSLGGTRAKPPTGTTSVSRTIGLKWQVQGRRCSCAGDSPHQRRTRGAHRQPAGCQRHPDRPIPGARPDPAWRTRGPRRIRARAQRLGPWATQRTGAKAWVISGSTSHA
jgi:hypothetical protein